jgi:hypothetical protein
MKRLLGAGRRAVVAQRVEVTGVPDGDRPRCVKCNKPLRMETRATWGPSGRVMARIFTRWHGYHASVDRGRLERFCTFARRAFDSGYRIEKRSPSSATRRFRPDSGDVKME